MKMADVRVGMRLKSTRPFDQDGIITVTEITEDGFRYRLSDDATLALVPRWGWYRARDGHEHFGIDGEALYEPV